MLTASIRFLRNRRPCLTFRICRINLCHKSRQIDHFVKAITAVKAVSQACCAPRRSAGLSGNNREIVMIDALACALVALAVGAGRQPWLEAGTLIGHRGRDADLPAGGRSPVMYKPSSALHPAASRAHALTQQYVVGIGSRSSWSACPQSRRQRSPGLSRLLAMHNHNERADVLLNAVWLALPGERPVIRPNCF